METSGEKTKAGADDASIAPRDSAFRLPLSALSTPSALGRVPLLLGLVRFSHTLFALPFALLSALMAWLAEPRPEWRWQEFLGIVLCMTFARSTAMAFNRLVDRRLDAQNPRTAGRHLPAGLLSVRSVLVFTIVCAIGFVASTALFLPNRLPLLLAVPVLALLCGYSFAKRFTRLAHFWLGAALMLAPVAAWIALRGEVAWPPVILGAAVLAWVAGFDIIYACQDIEVDQQLKLYSVPSTIGVGPALRLAAACHALMVVLLAILPWAYPEFGLIYRLGVAGVAVLLVYEHWLVRPDDLSRVNEAFFHVNVVVSLGLLAIGALDLLS